MRLRALLRALGQAALFGAFALSAARVHASEQLFSVYANVAYSSLYMSDGFRIGGDHPVWQPSLELTVPVPGVSLALWSSLQIDRQNQQYDEYDLMAIYRHDFATDRRYAVNLHGYLDYWTYPKLNTVVLDSHGAPQSQNLHGNKLHAGVSMTRLLPLLGSYVVPSYNLYYWLYWARNQSQLYQGGAHHEILLSYYHDLPKLFAGLPALYSGVSGSANYNDGAFGVQPGWSHAIAQLSAGASAASWYCALSLNRQWSFIPSVDPDNELWTMLSLTKHF